MRVLPLLLLLPACAQQAPQVEFAETLLSPEEVGQWKGVRSAHHEIMVRRTLRTPDTCRDLEADAVLAGGEVVLRVSALPTGEACPPGEGIWGYVAEIRGLEQGMYQLRVVHSRGDRRGMGTTEMVHPIRVE